MSDTVDALILDLLEWIGPGARPASEVLEAWRTSCPRLPVWEEANDRGFVVRQRQHGGRDHCGVRRRARAPAAKPGAVTRLSGSSPEPTATRVRRPTAWWPSP